ncbi:MAG: Gfo/Idh/MocA family oxidoreductase [Clostridia bacterium]|nr:Gfo/Idh/MocA family oxidoreductase [Clostridia bacterium]
MNFLIIGTNFISDRFAEAASEVPGVSLYAVYSRKLETGRDFAAKYGIDKVYTDYEEALSDAGIDAVYVASPTLCHAEHTILALRAGKHVLCEKMMGADLSDFEKMKSCAKETGRILLEAMRPAHDPAYETVLEYLKRLGRLRRASFEFCQYSSRYDAFLEGRMTNAFNPAMKNTALADIGIYPLHAALMLLGEPKNVTARSVFLENGFEGEGVMTLDYGDMLASVVYSKITNSVTPSVIEGERGALTINKISAPTELVYYPRGASAEVIKLDVAPNNMVYEIAAFRDMTLGKKDPQKYMNITEYAQKIVENVYISSGISDKF